jgi:hypothetical protein
MYLVRNEIYNLKTEDVPGQSYRTLQGAVMDEYEVEVLVCPATGP